MAALDFPASPTLNQVYTANGSSWMWNGLSWVSVNPSSGASGSGPDRIFWENDQVITQSYTITANKNAITAGNVTINSGVIVTVPSGGRWVIV